MEQNFGISRTLSSQGELVGEEEEMNTMTRVCQDKPASSVMDSGLVTVDPTEALFAPGVAGASHHKLINPTGGPLAVKIKCSDNSLYKLRPVFCVCPAGGTKALEVGRAAGPAKQDKLVIQSLPCAEGTAESDVATLYKVGVPTGQVFLSLVASDVRTAAPLAAPTVGITYERLSQFDLPPAI